VQVDKVAAKQVRPPYVLDGEASYVPETDNQGQYYETAANLGDTGKCFLFVPDRSSKTNGMIDAMNEVAWCYLEGFGCKRDKVCDYRFFTRSRSRALPNSFMAIKSSASQQPVWLVNASRP
jgi:TPR repeat protein